MPQFTKTEENYIEHEVQLRLHNEKFNLQDQKFQSIENSINRLDSKIDVGLKHLDNKITWGIGIFIAISLIGWMLPIALQFIKV